MSKNKVQKRIISKFEWYFDLYNSNQVFIFHALRKFIIYYLSNFWSSCSINFWHNVFVCHADNLYEQCEFYLFKNESKVPLIFKWKKYKIETRTNIVHVKLLYKWYLPHD